MSIDKMIKCIADFDDKTCGIGATSLEIEVAEAELKVRFPASYRHFLMAYGWARFAFEELYGIGASVPQHLSLVANVLSERNEMHPSLPPFLVPVMNDGLGNHYCLDTRHWNEDECPIIFWDHEQSKDQTPEETDSSFDIWLTKLLAEL